MTTAYLRYAPRHMQRSITDQIKNALVALGWIGPAVTVPFGAQPVRFQTVRPLESELVSLTGNVVAVSFGNQTDDAELEMGGGLLETEHVLFVDCFGEEQAIAIALASDVRDLLTGNPDAGTRFCQLRDYTVSQAGDPLPGWLAEYTDVIREPVERELVRAHWQVVRATAVLSYPGSS